MAAADASDGGGGSGTVLRLQAGGFANWVGTQWLNLQHVQAASPGGPRPPPAAARRLLALDYQGRGGPVFQGGGGLAGADPAELEALRSAWGAGVSLHASISQRNPFLAAASAGGPDSAGAPWPEEGEFEDEGEEETEEEDFDPYGTASMRPRPPAVPGAAARPAESVGRRREEDKAKQAQGFSPDAVRLWSDFVTCRLPRKAYLEVGHWDCPTGPFSSFFAGCASHQGSQLEATIREEASDRMRLLMEVRRHCAWPAADCC